MGGGCGMLRRDKRGSRSRCCRPARPRDSRSRRGEQACLRAGPAGLRARSRAAPQRRAAGSSRGPGRRRARPRGRCGGGQRSAVTRGWATRSAAAALRPGRPRFTRPAGKPQLPVPRTPWGARSRGSGLRGLPGPWPSTLAVSHPAPALGLRGRRSQAGARAGAPGVGANHLRSALPPHAPFSGFAGPAGTF